MTGSLLVAGTTSNAGKSVVTTGLCRLLARRGISVAPFKAQNMSNNSMVCADGSEIGRAQWIQALAARAEPEAAMNPVLLKPGSDRRSHVVVMGKPFGEIASHEFVGGRSSLSAAAFEAYDDLTSRFDVVICEGAGSPTEINLRADDYINMGLARHGDIPTIVVGDIDRGGVFAAMHGTVALLEAADQRLITGFVVNKFRGDQLLLQPGLDSLEKLTGRPVYGVLPWRPDVWLDSEDALDLEGRRAATGTAALRIAVIRLPRISNFTDVDALGIEPGVDVVFASDPRALGDADVIVVPGTRATISDLAWMRSRGLDRAIIAHAAAGRPVLGICGGFQMLGTSIADPSGVEGSAGAHVDGLGLLDVHTSFEEEKVLRLPAGSALGQDAIGYEIHHGRISRGDSVEEFLGGARSDTVFGTMWHGSLEGDDFRRAWLREVAGPDFTVGTIGFGTLRERRMDLLADLIEDNLDVDALLELIAGGVPADLAILPPGDRR
ncbi:MAG: cobyric acid synthase [Actinomycetota bacterium]|nr:cobyric acid synthase [Actinomycetota bacterium]